MRDSVWIKWPTSSSSSSSSQPPPIIAAPWLLPWHHHHAGSTHKYFMDHTIILWYIDLVTARSLIGQGAMTSETIAYCLQLVGAGFVAFLLIKYLHAFYQRMIVPAKQPLQFGKWGIVTGMFNHFPSILKRNVI